MKRSTTGGKIACWALAALSAACLAVFALAAPRLELWQRVCGAAASLAVLTVAALSLTPRGGRWKKPVCLVCAAVCLAAFAADVILTDQKLHDILLFLACLAVSSLSFFRGKIREDGQADSAGKKENGTPLQ